MAASKTHSLDALLEGARRVSERLAESVKERRNLVIVSHHDADGLASASIMAKAIFRKKGNFLVRILGDLTPQTIRELGEEGFDFYIFCDLGGGLVKDLKEVLGKKWVVIDHHQVPKEELGSANVFNAWQFGFDGGLEVCSAGLAYFTALQMDEANRDLSWLAVVGAVADRQDQGEGRSLFGLNRRIVEDALASGCLAVKTDLLFYGRETRPIHETLALTDEPFIPGLSGNEDACLAALTSAGLRLRDGDRWRVIAELSEDEKKGLLDAIVPHLAPAPSASEKVKGLIGEVYTLTGEDEYSPLRDSRELATFLNACGRLKRPAVAISVLLGDRGAALQEGERALNEYKRILNRYIHALLSDESRILEKAEYAMVIGDGIVDEGMLGSLSSVLSGIPRFWGKPLLVRTVAQSGDVKFSARCAACLSSINLGAMMRQAAVSCGGVGGGHDRAAGARVPPSRLQDFLRMVDERLKREDEGQDQISDQV